MREQTQQLLIQDWRAIGAAMRVNNMPAAVIWGDFWQQSKFKSVMVGVNFMLGSDPDVTPRFGSGAIPAKGGRGYNTYQYQQRRRPIGCSPKAPGSSISPQRKTTYGDLQKLIRDDLAILPLFQGLSPKA